MLLVHVEYILNARSAAWSLRSNFLVFTTWRLSVRSFFCRGLFQIGRGELVGEHKDTPSCVLSPNLLTTRLLPIFFLHSSPNNEWPYWLHINGTIGSSMLHQCFGRRFRGSLIQIVGQSVSGSLRNLENITHLDLSVCGDSIVSLAGFSWHPEDRIQFFSWCHVRS